MPWRTGADELDRAAVAALTAALDAVDVSAEPGTGSAEVVIGTPGGARRRLQVRGVSRLDGAQARQAVNDQAASGPGIVVADELTREAQAVLRTARVGFLDRRGHLYLRDNALHLDLDVPPDPRAPNERPADPIRGRSGITIAAALLLDPDERLGVRELARRSGLPVSTTSKALTPMRDAALIHDGQVLLPDLFWALAEAWRPARIALAERPPERVGVIGGTVAAAALGAPVAAAANNPPDLYVTDPTDARALERRYGTASAPTRAATVAVEPTALVTRTARDHIAHPLFVALDLAQDRARGREILDGWHPDGAHRVW